MMLRGDGDGLTVGSLWQCCCLCLWVWVTGELGIFRFWHLRFAGFDFLVLSIYTFKFIKNSGSGSRFLVLNPRSCSEMSGFEILKPESAFSIYAVWVLPRPDWPSSGGFF